MRANDTYQDAQLRDLPDSTESLGCAGPRPPKRLRLRTHELCGYPASAGVSTFFAKTGYNSRAFGAIESMKLKPGGCSDADLRDPTMAWCQAGLFRTDHIFQESEPQWVGVCCPSCEANLVTVEFGVPSARGLHCVWLLEASPKTGFRAGSDNDREDV